MKDLDDKVAAVTGAEFEALVRRETEMWRQIIAGESLVVD